MYPVPAYCCVYLQHRFKGLEGILIARLDAHISSPGTLATRAIRRILMISRRTRSSADFIHAANCELSTAGCVREVPEVSSVHVVLVEVLAAELAVRIVQPTASVTATRT